MSDAQDTIELPAFGLTLTRIGDDGWFGIDNGMTRTASYIHAKGPFATASVGRPNGVRVSYSVHDEDPCAALLAEMTPDDVAAIRALGEQP